MRAATLPRAARVVGALLVISSLPSSPPATAQEQPAFGGYEVVATGTGFTVAPRIPAVLPFETPVEGTLGLATATLTTGGLGYGLASSAYPGTPIVGLRPLLEVGAGTALPIPDYPIVVESREHEEPQSSTVPGMTMATDVRAERSHAVADVGGFSLPGLVDVGSVRTVSTSTVDTTATASVETVLNEVDLLDGAIHIDTIRTVSSAGTDMTQTMCDGAVTVSGATVGDQPVTIDETGIHVAGDPAVPLADPGEAVATALESADIEVRVLGSWEACEGARADRATSGVLVSLPLPAVGAVPPGGRLDIILGASSARAAATAPFVADLATATVDTPPLDGADPQLSTPSPAAGVDAPAPSPPAQSSTPTVRQPLPTVTAGNEREPYSFGGVPAGLAIGLMLLAIPGSRRIRRYLDHVVTVATSP